MTTDELVAINVHVKYRVEAAFSFKLILFINKHKGYPLFGRIVTIFDTL